MNPIAVVHWQDNGVNKSKECFDQDRLNRITRILIDGNYVFVTCLCKGGAVVPSVKTRSVLRAI